MKEYFMTTERTGFSRWEESDIDMAFLLWKDPQVTRYISADGIFTDEMIRDRLNTEIYNGKTYGVQYWPVYELRSLDLIGCCGLRPLEDAYELGFHLRPCFWGKGLAFEAASAVIRYAFDVIGTDRLYAGHHPDNAASAHLLRKLGFESIGEKYYTPTGLYHPSYVRKRKP